MKNMAVGKTASIITIGNEIVTGKINDTNSAYLSRFLLLRGYRVSEILSVGDTAEDISKAVQNSIDKNSFTIVTGGLGPTHDDITTKTLCELFNVNTKFSPQVKKDVTRFYKKRGRSVPAVSERYFSIPENAIPLRNSAGVAPGLFIDGKLLLLPGVPIEMKTIIEEHGKKVVPHGGIHVAEKTIRIGGIAETQLLGMVDNLEEILNIVEIGVLPQTGSVDLRLTARAGSAKEAGAKLRRGVKLISKNISETIYGYDDDTIGSAIGKLLGLKKTLAVAESCTGGGIGSAITAVAGSSDYFLGGIIAYSNLVKERELGVPKSHIVKHGAVSKETALSMARGVRRKFKSTYGLSVTGIAGPNGGTKEKPVGLIYIAISGPEGDIYKELRLGPDRKQNRQRSVFESLNLLYGLLTGRVEPESASDSWRVYLVECKDGSYYCGVSNDVKKRIAVHNSGKGALYTKWKRPVTLIAKSPPMSKSESLSLELKVKKLRKKELKKKMVKKG